MSFPTAMATYDNVVKKYMTKFGFDLTINRYVDAEDSYNPPLVESFTVRGILFDMTLQSNGSGTFRSTLIESGDKQLYVLPPIKDSVNYSNNIDRLVAGRDTLVIGGKTYRIITFKEVNPSASDSALWELYIRA